MLRKGVKGVVCVSFLQECIIQSAVYNAKEIKEKVSNKTFAKGELKKRMHY